MKMATDENADTAGDGKMMTGRRMATNGTTAAENNMEIDGKIATDGNITTDDNLITDRKCFNYWKRDHRREHNN